MTSRPKLLSVVELGGYPDFSVLYRQAGFEVVQANSMRKALALVKQVAPEVVVAEFIYAPTYGSRISNLESLIAGIQSCCPQSRLIVFLDRENRGHLESLTPRFPVFEALSYPIDAQLLSQALRRAMACLSGPETAA